MTWAPWSSHGATMGIKYLIMPTAPVMGRGVSCFARRGVGNTSNELPVTSNKNGASAPFFYFIWWPWSDSNRHSLRNLILSQARLPIPPRGQKATDKLFCRRRTRRNLFNQTRTAICFVRRFFCRLFRRADFFINCLFNRGHFRCQTRRRF